MIVSTQLEYKIAFSRKKKQKKKKGSEGVELVAYHAECGHGWGELTETVREARNSTAHLFWCVRHMQLAAFREFLTLD